MVFSDDFLHFVKIKKKMCWIHQNYLVALIQAFQKYIIIEKFQYLVLIISPMILDWTRECFQLKI